MFICSKLLKTLKVNYLTKSTNKTELSEFVSKVVSSKSEATARDLYQIYARLDSSEGSQVNNFDTKALIESICENLESIRGTWQSGWHVETLGFDYGLVVKGGTKFRVGLEKIKSMKHGGAIVPGNECMVNIPNIALGVSPGYAFVFGDIYPDDIYMRFYINSASPTNSDLLGKLKSLLDELEVPYAFKFFTGLNFFRRSDNTVVYLTRDAAKISRPLLQGLRSRVAELCAFESPFFTLRLAPGISIARNPSGGESYGRYVCSILADGFAKSMHLNGGELIDALSAHLTRTGLDLSKIWALGDDDFVKLVDGMSA